MPTTWERRFVAGAPAVRIAPARSDGTKGCPVIRGHAAVYNDWYTLYEDDEFIIRERILPGAFNNAIREKQDVRALFNHDPSLILGRTKSGTLRLSLDSRGLVYEVDSPDTQVGRDVVTSLKRGDVDGSSFGFSVRDKGQSITRLDDPATGKRVIERDLKDLDLFDVSPVTYPAYVGTDSGARGRGDVRELVDRLKATARPGDRAKQLREMRLRGAELDEMRLREERRFDMEIRGARLRAAELGEIQRRRFESQPSPARQAQLESRIRMFDAGIRSLAVGARSRAAVEDFFRSCGAPEGEIGPAMKEFGMDLVDAPDADARKALEFLRWKGEIEIRASELRDAGIAVGDSK